MKKLLGIGLVILMLALAVVPAFAKGPGPANNGSANGNSTGVQLGNGVRTPFALSGTITSLDSNARTITVNVACGNRLGNPSISQTVTIQTTDGTRFLLRNPDGAATPITFDELLVDQKVSVHATLLDGTYTATRVTAGAKLTCIQ
ncbi:MAG: hypothetical protein C3F13_13615 [Anaerolineales bacterium]|nr:hypothetical protein [Anaerolineae bacterium]PWB51475.1 MAG: hypothetical protein C3F13_13615 [Anaerolineales bacterium]